MATTVNVFVAGCGVVGKEVIRQIGKVQRSAPVARYGFNLNLAGASDSSGHLLATGPDGLDADAVFSWKEKGNKFSAFKHEGSNVVKSWHDVVDKRNTILVDCTATDAVTPLLKDWLDNQGGVVMANKKPLTGPIADFEHMLGVNNYRRCYYESTAGAGTPFIASLIRIVNSGDQVKSIQGAFSGTLGFLVSGIQDGKPLSSLVREAKALGYTEPDPRDDLSGMDVARKALIMARTIGWKLEMKDVAIEALFPPRMASLTVDQFLDALKDEDAAIHARHLEAAKNNCVLRYVATVEGGKCQVGLKAVPKDSPLGMLKGTDNIMQLLSETYTKPLVIQGSGAGAVITANGVIADVIDLSIRLTKTLAN